MVDINRIYKKNPILTGLGATLIGLAALFWLLFGLLKPDDELNEAQKGAGSEEKIYKESTGTPELETRRKGEQKPVQQIVRQPPPPEEKPVQRRPQQQQPQRPKVPDICLYADKDTSGPVISDRFAPYGRLIKCVTVITVDSSKIGTPVIGLTREDVWHDGKLIISSGTEVHGTAQAGSIRDRVNASGDSAPSHHKGSVARVSASMSAVTTGPARRPNSARQTLRRIASSHGLIAAPRKLSKWRKARR